MVKCMLFSWPSTEPTTGNNFKRFSLRKLMMKHQQVWK